MGGLHIHRPFPSVFVRIPHLSCATGTRMGDPHIRWPSAPVFVRKPHLSCDAGTRMGKLHILFRSGCLQARRLANNTTAANQHDGGRQQEGGPNQRPPFLRSLTRSPSTLPSAPAGFSQSAQLLHTRNPQVEHQRTGCSRGARPLGTLQPHRAQLSHTRNPQVERQKDGLQPRRAQMPAVVGLDRSRPAAATTSAGRGYSARRCRTTSATGRPTTL